MLAALLCASCSSTEKRIYDAADEFGVSYNSSDWDKDNTFLYSYQSRNPEEDGSWNNFDRCSYIDCHAEDRRTLADSNAPLSLPFYICLDSSRYPSADFSTLQPILFYEAYTLVDSDDPYEYPYSAKPFDVSIASLGILMMFMAINGLISLVRILFIFSITIQSIQALISLLFGRKISWIAFPFMSESECGIQRQKNMSVTSKRNGTDILIRKNPCFGQTNYYSLLISIQKKTIRQGLKSIIRGVYRNDEKEHTCFICLTSDWMR